MRKQFKFPSQHTKTIQGIRRSGASGPHVKPHKSLRKKLKQNLHKEINDE